MPYNFTVTESGDLIFTDEIPKVFDGFEQDQNQKVIWHPLWEPCCHRTQQPFRCSNGGYRLVSNCALLEQTVSFAKCDVCTLPKTKDQEPPQAAQEPPQAAEDETCTTPTE